MTGTARLSPKSITSKPNGQREEQTLQILQVKVPRHSESGHGPDGEDAFQPRPARAGDQVEGSKPPVGTDQSSVKT